VVKEGGTNSCLLRLRKENKEKRQQQEEKQRTCEGCSENFRCKFSVETIDGCSLDCAIFRLIHRETIEIFFSNSRLSEKSITLAQFECSNQFRITNETQIEISRVLTCLYDRECLRSYCVTLYVYDRSLVSSQAGFA
jgi:hypothetical protein